MKTAALLPLSRSQAFNHIAGEDDVVDLSQYFPLNTKLLEQEERLAQLRLEERVRFQQALVLVLVLYALEQKLRILVDHSLNCCHMSCNHC